jgi:hypothetical protein
MSAKLDVPTYRYALDTPAYPFLLCFTFEVCIAQHALQRSYTLSRDIDMCFRLDRVHVLYPIISHNSETGPTHQDVALSVTS